MALTVAERSKLMGRLVELQAALDQAITGAKVKSIAAPGGRAITYGDADTVALRAEIAAVKSRLGIGGGRISLNPYF